ncbi:MAG TPA: hypothetical protein VFN24_06515 [Microbacterium sp.]|nr:hypothetical protein [Microbacterium sp.]
MGEHAHPHEDEREADTFEQREIDRAGDEGREQAHEGGHRGDGGPRQLHGHLAPAPQHDGEEAEERGHDPGGGPVVQERVGVDGDHPDRDEVQPHGCEQDAEKP